jgi:hypothetical protein
MTRHTKRFAALASLIVTLLATLLAVPTAAMASTAGPAGSPSGGPSSTTIVCPPLRLLHGKHVKVKVKVLRLRKHPKGKPVQVRIVCPPPFPAGCRLRPLVFDAASGSSTLTEVSGPTLAPAEEFFYAGSIYTINTVNPGADSFTVFHDNFLFTNSGPAITNGHGIMLCSPPKSLNN